MTADPAQSQTLSPYSAGMKHYVGDEATARILEATGLRWKSNLDVASFSSQLNDIVRFTMLRMLSLPYSKKEFCKLEKAFLAYEELSKKRQTSDFFPPLTPRDWHLKATKWFAEMNKLYENRSKGGAPKNLIYQYFYPRAIALYYAGFGVEPVATTYEGKKSFDGPTACFLRAIFDEVEKSIDSFGFGEGYTLDQIVKLRRFKTTPAALRKNINKAMHILEPEFDEHWCQLRGINPEEAAQRLRRPAWRIWAEYFEKFILTS